MKVYCLFEQSGTFKNEFKKLGYDAFDIDIENRFNQTDIIEDLFSSIRNENGIFDMITKDDLVISFFPCIRFSTRAELNCRCENSTTKIWDTIRKIDYSKKFFNEVRNMYSLWCDMFSIAFKKGFKMVVKNPYNPNGILQTYFPIKPSIIDKDRSLRGDNFKKPTQYWFINFEPKHNFIFENNTQTEIFTINNTPQGIKRSLINPNYARTFIKEFILNEKSLKI